MTKLEDSISTQLSNWTVVGWFQPTVESNYWFQAELDGATSIPKASTIQGKSMTVKAVTGIAGEIDFGEHLGHRDVWAQGYALTELTVSQPVTVKLTYDADWMAVWWLDGKEIFASRQGNAGAVGTVHYPIYLALEPGRHVLCVRVVGGVMGWRVLFDVEFVKPGILDMLRTDRDAHWRDYRRTMIRHEHRPPPTGQVDNVSKEVHEQACANSGVDARWIGVVHANGQPYFKSESLPTDEMATEEHERQLKEWVDLLHARKLAAMSWFPMTHSKPAWLAHPEWRQHYLVPPKKPMTSENRYCLCVLSGYGEALINFTIEAIKKFDLDGMWFDGSFLAPIWYLPQTVTCACQTCVAAFHKATGLNLPSRFDWTLPEMPRFVKWRADSFVEYWQRLVDAVHAEVPQASIAFNHYHREQIGWNGGIPLNKFGHDFISATEADLEPLRGAMYTRIMRAYGRKDTEVWLSLTVGSGSNFRGPTHNPRQAVDFALSCATAGGNASFGGGSVEVAMPTIAKMAEQLHPRRDYINLPSVPHLALHISQQSETFVFGRNPDFTQTADWCDYYWNSVVGWHHALAFAGQPCDVIFDDGLSAAQLKKYPILLMPLPTSLEQGQYRQIMNYVREGGILIAGPWFGLCDQWGQEHSEPVGPAEMFPFGRQLFTWDQLKNRQQIAFDIPTIKERLLAKPLSALVGQQRKVALSWDKGSQVVRRTKVGKGQVLQLAVDLGTLYRWSNSPLAVSAVKSLMDNLPRPMVETVDGQPLLSGIFRKGKKTIVAQLQQFAPPWDASAGDPEPLVRWHTEVRYNGPRPKSIRCALPNVGPELALTKSGKGWSVQLPPLTWGQVLLIET